MKSSSLAPFTVFYENSEEFHHLKNEIFTQGVYYVELENPAPVIIDAGAHIGLTTLYFKKLFPNANITAIEPNPAVLPLLEKNIFENQITDVTVHPVALAAQTEEKNFYLDDTDTQWFSTAGFSDGAWNRQQHSVLKKVQAVPLTDFLDRPIDFLKMDIEGAEQEVLLAAGSQIRQVHHMIVEFHPVAHQSLPKLLQFFHEQGFKTQLWKDGESIEPNRVRGLCYIEAKQKK